MLITPQEAYFVIHGTTTLGALIVFLVRNEHRITKLETRMNNLEKSHDTLTGSGTIPHVITHKKGIA